MSFDDTDRELDQTFSLNPDLTGENKMSRFPNVYPLSIHISKKLWSRYHKGLLYWPERRMDWASLTWGDHLRLWSISQSSQPQGLSGCPTDTLYFLKAGQDSHRGVVLVKSMTSCWEGQREMGLQRELAATASFKLCLWGLLQKPGLWKTPHPQEGLCGCQGTIVVLWVLGWSVSGSHG